MDAATDVFLVTGASSGIGRALAKRLWNSDKRVVVTARAQSLDNIYSLGLEDNERFLIRPLDVNKVSQRVALVDEIYERWDSIDVLINNAGISYRSVIEHMSDQDEIDQLSTNFLAPMALTRLVLPRMRERRKGRIINVSSVGGMMAMPTMGSYSASKFALEGASEALWYEMKPWGIFVTLVQPGFINSNSFKNVRWSNLSKDSASGNDDYCVYYRQMGAFISRLMESSFATSDSVAKKILKVAEAKNPPLRVTATLDAHFFSLLRRVLPRGIYHWVLYRALPGISKWGQSCK